MATGHLRGPHGEGGTDGLDELQDKKGTQGPCGEPAAPGHGPETGVGEQGTWGMRVSSLEGQRPRQRHEETQRYGTARVQLQVHVTASNTCPLGGWPHGTAVGSDFHLETLKLFTGGDRRPRATNLHTPALNRHQKTRVNSCKQREWSHFKREPELPPQRDPPGPSDATNLWMLKQDKTIFGQSLKQHCIPKNCSQG